MAIYRRLFRVPYSIHSSCEEILELVRRVRPVRVVPIVEDSPCPFELIAPLLSRAESEAKMSEAKFATAKMSTAKVSDAKPSEAKVSDLRRGPVCVLVPAPPRRKRVGVSDERAAEIAEQIARNGQRLGVAKKAKEEPAADIIDLEST